MRAIIRLPAVLMAIALAGVPTGAGAHSDTMVKADTLPPTLIGWSDRVFNDISARLRVHQGMGVNRTPSGIVAVKFNCSETGAPADVAIYKSSGVKDLDRATLSAVRQVASLHPLPAGMRREQVYIVRILFANSPESAGRQLSKMRRDAAKSNAWYDSQAAHTAAIELAPLGG